MKRTSILLLTIVLLSSLIYPVCSDGKSFPNAFWKLSDEFVKASEAGDDDGIIESGKSICDLLENSVKNEDTVAVLGTRYNDIALAYERKCDFTSAALYYEKYLPYGEMLGWDDGVRIARAKIESYTPKVCMYREIAENRVVYGAKGEPKSGVLFGQVADRNPIDDSMAMLYIDVFESLLGEEKNMLSALNRNILENAAKDGLAVVVALNFPQNDIWTDSGKMNTFFELVDNTLDELSPYAKKIPTLYIRIGAEPDVWENPVSPSAYISAYLTVAEKVRRMIPEAALVWSINHVPSWNINADDYYPGDHAVDWVGISLYATPFFLDKKYEKDDRQDEILFREGRAADPVLMVKKIVETYGDRKPIMLSECGVAHDNSILGDSTEWAVYKMREYYGYLPMVYPQIKLISYFNTRVMSETNDYSLYTSEALQQTYYEVTRQNLYIHDNPLSIGNSYTKLVDEEVPARLTLGTYVHLYDTQQYKVEYRVDGVWTALSDKPPFRVTLGLSSGRHDITASVLSSDGLLLLQNTVTVTATDEVSIVYNGRLIEGDVPPVVSEGRTLVPLRLIFTAMGAEVSWDPQTRTVVSTLGDRTVRMTVDEKEIERDGEKFVLEVAPTVRNNRTLVPVRAVAESFGAEVRWDSKSRTVQIDFDASLSEKNNEHERERGSDHA